MKAEKAEAEDDGTVTETRGVPRLCIIIQWSTLDKTSSLVARVSLHTMYENASHVHAHQSRLLTADSTCTTNTSSLPCLRAVESGSFLADQPRLIHKL